MRRMVVIISALSAEIIVAPAENNDHNLRIMCGDYDDQIYP
jgi:hypothetical protein